MASFLLESSTLEFLCCNRAGAAAGRSKAGIERTFDIARGILHASAWRFKSGAYWTNKITNDRRRSHDALARRFQYVAFRTAESANGVGRIPFGHVEGHAAAGRLESVTVETGNVALID